MTRTLIHIVAGNDNWHPTADELQKLVNNFQTSNINAVSNCEVRRIEVPDEALRIVISAGDDGWSPSQEELDAIVEQFQQATTDIHGIVATRRSVRAVVI